MLNADFFISGARRQQLLFTHKHLLYIMYTHAALYFYIFWICFSDELRRVRTEKEDLHKETERWKAEQIKEWDEERQQHKCVQLILDICSIHIFPVSQGKCYKDAKKKYQKWLCSHIWHHNKAQLANVNICCF